MLVCESHPMRSDTLPCLSLHQLAMSQAYVPCKAGPG